MAHGPDIPRVRRAGVLLQAALLTLSLFAAPAVHRKTCDGVCAEHRQSTRREEASPACCGGAESGRSGKDGGGCRCLDDCCSIVGYCVSPDGVPDTAPPVLLPTDSRTGYPEWTPRAPEAQLLPYPTGPPPTA